MSRTIVNIVCSVLVLAVNVVINLVLSPIIVATLGAEANGFVTLANNCVTYAQLLTTAISSMAARFITIEYAKGNHDKANLYYNSIFWGNLVLTLILIVPATGCVVCLELLFDVPADILWDVKLLFAFVFANFLVTSALPKYDCSTFAVNRLDRSYIPQAIGQIIRCVVVFSLFALFVPHVWYVGAAASIMTAITLIANAYNTHALTPELKVKIKKGERRFSFRALKELFFSGIWNSIQSVGTMLLSGMDILISNILLNAASMGTMSLAKTLVTLLQQLSASICNALAPELTIDWAKKNTEQLLHNIDRAMALTSGIMTVPLAGIIVFGDWFYELWVPDQDAILLWALSTLAVLGYAFASGTQILYNIFTVVNKVRPNALSFFVCGIISVIITFLLVRFTPLGLFAIAGVSTVVNFLRNLVFTLPMAARYLECKWTRFYPQFFKSGAITLALVLVGFVLKQYLPSGSWLAFIISVLIFAVVGFAFNSVVFLNSDDRRMLKEKAASKLISLGYLKK